MLSESTVPFNPDYNDAACAELAGYLFCQGLEVRAEYLGDGTSLIVQLAPDRQVLLRGWGELDGWRAEYDTLIGTTWEREYDTAVMVPDTDLNRLDLLGERLTAWLWAQIPD